ncbi:hypothetical protein KM043_014805 [Ampulex compressa]|nr:hypothetical protein KM043_014805 [Ampulex compressa]
MNKAPFDILGFLSHRESTEQSNKPVVYQSGRQMLMKPILPAKRAQRIETDEKNRSVASGESEDAEYAGSEEETEEEEAEDADAEEEERLAKLRVKYIKDPGQRLYYYVERRK